MKKLIFLVAMLCSGGSLFAQSITGAHSATNGETVTLSGSGESYSSCPMGQCGQFYFFDYFLNIDNSKNTYAYTPSVPNPASYVSVSLVASDHFFSQIDQTPSRFRIKVTNTSLYPVTVTFKVSCQWELSIPGTSYTNSKGGDLSYTMTVNPTGYVGGPGPATGPPLQTLFAGPWASIPSYYANQKFFYTYDDINYDVQNGRSTKIPMSLSPMLLAGQSIYSPDHNTRLANQLDGNIVLYHKNADGTETATWGSHSQNPNTGSLYFQTDVNWVLYNASNVAVWGSHTNLISSPGWFQNYATPGSNYPFWALQNDGNFVLYWPTVDKYNQQCYVIFAATGTGGFQHSAHVTTVHYPTPGPVNTSYGTNLLDYGSTFKAGTAN